MKGRSWALLRYHFFKCVSLYKRQQANHPHHLPLPKLLLLEPSYEGALIEAIQLKYTDFSYLDTSTLMRLVPFSKRKK